MNRFTSKQLADFLLPGYPTTSVGWDKLLVRKGWEFTEEKGRGRGGIRREYTPPPEVQALIEARHRGELPPAPVRATAQQDQYRMVPSAAEYAARERDAAAMLLEPNPEDRLRMLQMVLRISEMQLTTPPPPDVAKKVIALAEAWQPFASKFPDLKERLDTLKATASFFI